MKDTLNMIIDKGADKASLSLELTNTEEFNVIFKELNLLRSLESINYSIVIIKDNRQASTSLNQLDKQSISTAVDKLMKSLEGANEDPAFDISPYHKPFKTEKGPQEGNFNLICTRLNELTNSIKKMYPTVHFDAILSYEKQKTIYLNSNNVDFEETKGYYQFILMFSAKDGNKISSLNYNFFAYTDIEDSLINKNFTDLLIKQISEQTTTKSISDNFTGDIILMPFISAELLVTLLDSHIGDNAILFKTSRFPDHINKKILDEKLTIHTRPLDPDLCTASGILPDGFAAENATLIDKGVLKHYPISIYVANKTGMKRTIGPNKTYVIEPGYENISKLISTIKQGVFCARISYGAPNSNGDFSGVLKNSYYIENGKIAYPLSETMMSANLIDMFNNIKGISCETVNTGSFKAPFMLLKDIYFSKK